MILSQKKFNIIVATDNESIIGIKEYGEFTLPWPYLKEDMNYFRKTTANTLLESQINAIIVGYNTWETTPDTYRKNTKRKNIVISRTHTTDQIHGSEMYVQSFEDALAYASNLEAVDKIWVIGGAVIYDVALSNPLLETIYLTHVKHSYPRENVIDHAICFPLSHDHLQEMVVQNFLKLINNPVDIIDTSKNISFCFKIYQTMSGFHEKYARIEKNPRIVIWPQIIPVSLTVDSTPGFVCKHQWTTLEEGMIGKAGEMVGEYQYLNLIRKIMRWGNIKSTRNGITKSIFGYQLSYDLAEGYPVSTVKKSYPKTIFEELMWIIRGQTDVKKLQAKNVHVWDKNSTRDFLQKCGLPYDEGDIGPGYGFQMRHYGAPYINCNTDYTNLGIDQLQNCIDLIKHHPQSRRIVIDMWNCNDIQKMALPPCFLPDTLVLTNRGYIKITQVTINDLLLTHQGIMRQIKKIYRTPYNGQIIYMSAESHPREVGATPDHPFYVKVNSSSDPEWLCAKNLKPNYAIGFPINQESHIPTFINQTVILDDPKYWLAMGYYLLHGRMESDANYEKIVFEFEGDSSASIYPIIRQILKLQPDTFDQSQRLTNILVIVDSTFSHIFKDFSSDHGRIIPEWIQNGPIKLVAEFARGCMFGSRHTQGMSPHIAFGLQRLFAKLGEITTVQSLNPSIPDTYTIQTAHQIGSSYISDGYVWFNIDNVRDEIGLMTDVYVYNFDVDHDHSYIVENLATHNCHVIYNFGVDLYDKPHNLRNTIDESSPTSIPIEVDTRSHLRGKLNCHVFQRSWDVMLGWNTTTAALLTYLIAHHCDLDPGCIVHSITDAHLYQKHIECGAIDKLLARTPRKLPTIRFINKKANIEDYQFDDLVIENYYPCPAIHVELTA